MLVVQCMAEFLPEALCSTILMYRLNKLANLKLKQS